jgi:hypothetical protein
MSNLTVRGNPSGTGTIILESPNTNSNRTITLPDATATLASTAYVDAASSIVHLGTIATTSGSSASLSSLTLTGYKQLQFSFNGLSSTASTAELRLNSYKIIAVTVNDAAQFAFGGGTIDLANGVFWSSAITYDSGGTIWQVGGFSGLSGLTTSSTSITFTCSAGTFDAGSIRIYGVK